MVSPSVPRAPFFLTKTNLNAAVLPLVKNRMVDEAEEEVSGMLYSWSRFHFSYKTNTSVDWEGSDGDYGSSEPMDSIAELGEIGNDLIDTDPWFQGQRLYDFPAFLSCVCRAYKGGRIGKTNQ